MLGLSSRLQPIRGPLECLTQLGLVSPGFATSALHTRRNQMPGLDTGDVHFCRRSRAVVVRMLALWKRGKVQEAFAACRLVSAPTRNRQQARLSNQLRQRNMHQSRPPPTVTCMQPNFCSMKLRGVNTLQTARPHSRNCHRNAR